MQDKNNQEIKRQDYDLGMKHSESIINTELKIKVYEFKTGMVGPFLEAFFYNKNYIFTVEAVYPHIGGGKDGFRRNLTGKATILVRNIAR